MGFSIFPTPSSGGSGYPSGTTAERPVAPTAGTLYYDVTLGTLLIYSGDSWNTFIIPPDIATPTTVVATNVGTNRLYNNGSASVAFTKSAENGSLGSLYTVTSTPGSFTATGKSSPIIVTGLQSAVSYTFKVAAGNMHRNSGESAASASITATTLPQVPTIGAASNYATPSGGMVSVAFTPGATGGSAITAYTVTSSPGDITATGTSSPIIVQGLTNGTPYTFTVTATNANGTTTASSATSSVTPVAPPPVVGGTLTSDATYYYRTFTVADTLAINSASLTFDYILVGGGGGGAGSNGAGGSGGQKTYGTSLTKTQATYPIVIGGGAGNLGTGGTTTAFGLSAGGGGGGNANGGGGYTWLNGVTYGTNGPNCGGSTQSPGQQGTDGLGNGGKGGWYNNDGGRGGHGTVVIRYTRAQVGG